MTDPLTPYLAIQKYLEVLESVQKALGFESASEPKQVFDPELEDELIELETLEPDLEIGSGIDTWTAEQQTEEKSYLTQLKAENMKMRTDNYQKFLQSQAYFAQSKALFAASQAKFSARRQDRRKQPSLRSQ
jgi:hypothetical protein